MPCVWLCVQADTARNAHILRCDMSVVRRALGLPDDAAAGGNRALIASAQLSGGDYNLDGAKRVGSRTAFLAARTLLAGLKVCCCQTDDASFKGGAWGQQARRSWQPKEER